MDDHSRSRLRTGRSGGLEPDPAYPVFLSYINRSREYYAAKGFTVPYRWATNCGAPFAPLTKPLAQCRLGVVTTSFVDDPANSSQDSATKAVEAVPTAPIPETMFTADLSWHKKATNTDDVESFLPLRTLTALVGEGRVGELAPRFYSIPTVHSQRLTQADAEVIDGWARDDELDAVLLIPL